VVFVNKPVGLFFYLFLAIILTGILFPALSKSDFCSVQAAGFATAINPDSYIVAPSDRFRVDFLDGSSEPIEITVLPEGIALLSSMGAVDVGGLSLTEAKNKIRSMVGDFYDEDDFTINLIGIREIDILITGGVKNPGMYSGVVANRASEIIQKAGGLVPGASYRNIILSSERHDLKVDLLAFERAGITSANPYLYAGNVIEVPMVSDSSTFVYVSSEVARPGGFEYKPGDDIDMILKLSLGLTGLQGDSIYIHRKADDGYSLMSISIKDIDTPVMPGDKIIVQRRRDDRPDGQVTITGEIKRPGVYPYAGNENFAKLMDISGGITEKADLLSTAIYRKPEYVRGSENDVIYKNVGGNQIDIGLGREPLSLDMIEYSPDNLYRINLQPGDSIIVPRLTGAVGIYGMVKKPGMVSWSKPGTIGNFVALAGGYNGLADKDQIEVIRKTTGLKIFARSGVTVLDGDTIIIPKKLDKKTFWDHLKDISLFLGGAAVVYLAIDNVVD